MSEYEAGYADGYEVGVKSATDLQNEDIKLLLSKVSQACDIIRWFRENDETNQGDIPLPEHGGQTWDEINSYWIEGLNRASKFLIENDTVELPR